MVKVAVKGMQTDRFEIRPGQANQLKMMNRLAPGFILKQMSRSLDGTNVFCRPHLAALSAPTLSGVAPVSLAHL
jgi:hypothetical protein